MQQKPAARVVMLQSRGGDEEVDGGMVDEELDESAGLLGSGTSMRARRLATQPSTAGIIPNRVWLVVCAMCATLCVLVALRVLLQPDKPALDAKAVVQLEAALQKQRQQLLELQSHLSQNALAVAGCADRWAVQYPLELDKWDGHSCSWKKKWAQCGEFAPHCAKTCGTCTPSGGGGSTKAPQRRPAPQIDIAVETVIDDDDEEDPDDALPPVTTTVPRVPRAEPGRPASAMRAAPGGQGGVGIASAAEIMAAAASAHGAPHPAASRPEFVGGARTQQGVLKRLHGTPRAGLASSDASRRAYRYGEGDGSEGDQHSGGGGGESTPGIDDSYEGPGQNGAKEHALATLGEGAPPADETPEAARARYVAGDGDSAISAASECGIPIREPAVSAEFAMAAVRAKPSTGPKGRRYSTVTYLSSVITLHAGEVSHLVQSVKLPRPEGGIGVAHYAVELMQQTADEVRPARADKAYLKRLTLQPSIAPLGTRARPTCPTQPPVVAGGGRKLTQVQFPHPHGIAPNASDVWMAEVHLIRTDGLAGPVESAQQCLCMREDIGSVHCCPHSCRFASSSHPGPAASYRVSVSLTWLLVADDPDESSSSGRRAMRPVSALWVPVGGEGASLAEPKRAARRCRAADGGISETEIDVAARSASKRYGPWLQLGPTAVGVAALAIGAPRVRALALTSARAEDAQKELCKTRGSDEEVKACSLRALAGGGVVQARAELDVAAQAARGLDVGWVMYTSSRR